MSLQTKLVSLRKQNGLTQLDLAEKLNVSRQAISRWEVGSAVPSTDNLKVLSELYNVSLDYLLNDDEEPPYKNVDSQEQVKPVPKKRHWMVLFGISLLLVLIVAYSINKPKQEAEEITPIKDMTIVEDEYTTYTFSFD